jgi:DNA-binding beta-propeller fold protein YncE
VAVHPSLHTVWICEQDGDRVRHYQPDGAPIAATALPGPTRIAVDSTSKSAWVTSLETGQVYRLNELAQRRDSVQLAGPIGIAVDWRRGQVWVADATGDAVVCLDAVTAGERFRVTRLGEPRDLSVDLATGECWVTARGEDAVYRIAADGRVLARLGGFSDPIEVRVDPGR